MIVAPAALFACVALIGSAMAQESEASFLQLARGDGVEDEADLSLDLDMDELFEDKPKKRNATHRKSNKTELTASLDQIIPLLESDFKNKTSDLKLTLAYFKEQQASMDIAKREATQAMKALRKEAEKRRKTVVDRKMAKKREVEAKQEAKRTAKEAMVKKAQTLIGAKGSTEMQGMLGSLSLGIMVEVLMALPAATDNPIFIKRMGKAKDQIVKSVQDFLNVTRRKTAKFVLASSKASDVELSFIMARYFHEASFRVKSMQTDAEKVARDLNVVMPRELRQSFLPIIKQLRMNAVPLKVNASTLSSSSLASACTQLSGLMANISDYNTKLSSMHTALHNVWQITELMLPHMGKIYPMKTIVIDTVKDFMSLATTQTAGLQEAADEIVTNVGPVINERMQCTWSAAYPRFGLSAMAVLATLASFFFA